MKLTESFNESEDVFIVYSMSLEVCKIARSSCSKICKGELYSTSLSSACSATPENVWKPYFSSYARRYYAKSFDGFKTRIVTKITAKTVIQYINKHLFNRNINNFKDQYYLKCTTG